MPPPTTRDDCLAKIKGPAESYHCHCEERSDVAIRIFCDASPALEGLARERIATGFALAMTRWT